MRQYTSALVTGPAVAALTFLVGCGGVSEMTREQVARSETIVQQTERTGISSEGALELQQAKDKLAQARRAMDEGDEKAAERLAKLAQLEAELALAKTRSKIARDAAQETVASIETLRREATRSQGTGATAPGTTADETQTIRR